MSNKSGGNPGDRWSAFYTINGTYWSRHKPAFEPQSPDETWQMHTLGPDGIPAQMRKLQRAV